MEPGLYGEAAQAQVEVWAEEEVEAEVVEAQEVWAQEVEVPAEWGVPT